MRDLFAEMAKANRHGFVIDVRGARPILIRGCRVWQCQRDYTARTNDFYELLDVVSKVIHGVGGMLS